MIREFNKRCGDFPILNDLNHVVGRLLRGKIAPRNGEIKSEERIASGEDRPSQ
jgi:hypothetical protein